MTSTFPEVVLKSDRLVLRPFEAADIADAAAACADAYVDVKDLAVEVAESWAAETGWTVGAPEEGGAGKPGRVR
ncbi:hypothetical protein [Actinacidiphila soli]|uniref:hypothetical protein n=1 Tax=Actinacidiphila soli TaxID=2487275 RepID=UPI000FCB0FA2|nr:hypothetical protein [Actinacidiphila soli]